MESDRCEQCGERFAIGPKKRIGKRAWCSKKCMIDAGIEPKPERKVYKRKDKRPRQVVYNLVKGIGGVGGVI